MFFTSPTFWILMGMLFVVVGLGFKALADDQGWSLTWWKWLLAIVTYGIFTLSLFAYGTLVGENEASAGLKLLLTGLFITVVLGVGLWRLLTLKPSQR